MKQGDKIRITAAWDTGDLFGKLEGETEYTIAATEKPKSFWGALFGGGQGEPSATIALVL